MPTIMEMNQTVVLSPGVLTLPRQSSIYHCAIHMLFLVSRSMFVGVQCCSNIFSDTEPHHFSIDTDQADELIITPPAKCQPPATVTPAKKKPQVVTPFSKLQLAAAKRSEAAEKDQSKKVVKVKDAPKETCNVYLWECGFWG